MADPGGLSTDDLAFLAEHHSAAMITVGADGAAKAVRVGIALVDDFEVQRTYGMR